MLHVILLAVCVSHTHTQDGVRLRQNSPMQPGLIPHRLWK